MSTKKPIRLAPFTAAINPKDLIVKPSLPPHSELSIDDNLVVIKGLTEEHIKAFRSAVKPFTGMITDKKIYDNKLVTLYISFQNKSLIERFLKSYQ